MNVDKIKPIPKYILNRIRKAEMENNYWLNTGYTRFYSYFTKNDGELVQVTVACKNRINSPRWRCKQVVIHGIHSEVCYLKDIVLHFMGNYSVGWFDEGLQKERKWYETSGWGRQEDKYFNIYCTVLNKEYLTKLPEYKYSAVMQYPYRDILRYLRLYEKYPQAEMLVKFGLAQYATSVQILRKTGKDKQFRKWLIQRVPEIKYGNYYVGTILLGYKAGKPLDKVQELETKKKSFYRQDGYKDIKRLFNTNKEITALIEYIQEQDINLSSYSDYLRACEYLGLDMTLPKNRMPHNFKYWHDLRINEYHSKQAELDKEKRKELYAKFAEIADKYSSLAKRDNVYVVMIAKSPADLVNEGEALHHCVGRMGYDQKFAEEKSLIFFVRSAGSPETPLATLEYSLKNNRILQLYGDCNDKPQKELEDYINKKWLPYANRQIRKIQKTA